MTKTTKQCNSCYKVLSLDNFYLQKHKRKNKTVGITVRRYHSAYCKSCEREKVKAYVDANRDEINKRKRERLKNDPEYKDRVNESKRQSARRNLEANMVSRARKRATKLGIEFSITKEDIIIPEYCPLLGVKLEAGTKGKYSMSPSLDKIDPTKGYTKDNIWVISTKANTMKSNATKEELITFAKNIMTKMI
jgi:hypothetical protein